MKLYQTIAQLIGAIHRCEASGNVDWRNRHSERLDTLVKRHFPSGSGFDVGTGIDVAKSTDEKLIFHTSFHHMNDGGMYDGWTDHTIIVRPSLAHRFSLTIRGRDRNAIKDYIGDVFSEALNTIAPMHEAKEEATHA